MDNKVLTKNNILTCICIFIVSFVLCVSGIFYSPDKFWADRVYQVPSPVNKNIVIIKIDEKTIAEYGDPSTWNREIPAKLIEKLTGESGSIPKLIVMDFLYIGEKDEDSDTAFVKACEKNGNVITAINLVRADRPYIDANGNLQVEKDQIKLIEYPYEGLKNVTDMGISNTHQDKDGYIRFTQLFADNDGESLSSIAWAAYEKYCTNEGINIVTPKMDSQKITGFTFSGKSGAYGNVSLCDVLDDSFDANRLKNSIVFVGAYAPGLMDSYNVSIQRGAQMYGVEIHANIFESLLEGKTNLPADKLLYALIISILAVLFFCLARKTKIFVGFLLMLFFIAGEILAGVMLYKNGISIQLIELPVIVICIYVYHVATKYIVETIKRKKVVSAFKKYVAPQIVDELSKKGEFHIELGGTSRHIAVLFVDIRGFTPMSENLKPEQVVEILNEYLSLTTNSIFKNGGTLDKFIGDATMAVFNAPFDLDDYIYRAVCAARDIAAGSEELQKRLMEKFGRTISYGIGVNCGEAVVGNIGCEFRMDYTAIGDTVNTAARLESNAKAGQILISESVYEAIKDRLKVSEIGEIPLKGKSKGVFVYSVDEVL